jgi:SagB-type dehydrogenase family enzyme
MTRLRRRPAASPAAPFLIALGATVGTIGVPPRDLCPAQEAMPMDTIRLPAPDTAGRLPVERALSGRRSVRSFAPGALSLAELGQLLWAAQGVTREAPGVRGGGLRTAPSAGALYPLELLVAAGSVTDLPPGLYRYLPSKHALAREGDRDLRAELSRAALGQSWIAEAPAVLVFAAVIERTAAKYGDRAGRYVHIEVGAAAENVYLQCEALGLGTTFVGAFRDADVKRVGGLARDEDPIAILPVGKPASPSARP